MDALALGYAVLTAPDTRHSSAERNRAAFPELARIVDLFRQHFGPGVRLLHGIEGGRELGRARTDDAD